MNLMAGAFEGAAVDFDRAIAIYESTPTAGQEGLLDDASIPALNTLALSAWNQCYLGYLDQALSRIDSATAIARRADSRGGLEGVHTLRNSFLICGANLSKCERELRQQWCWPTSSVILFAAL